MPGRLADSCTVATASLPPLAGDSEAVVKRPTAEVAAFCRRLPALWRSACADASHTCLPRVILDYPDSPEEVTVPLNGGSATLPNIHPHLLLLAQLQPGRQRVGWGAPVIWIVAWSGVDREA